MNHAKFSFIKLIHGERGTSNMLAPGKVLKVPLGIAAHPARIAADPSQNRFLTSGY